MCNVTILDGNDKKNMTAEKGTLLSDLLIRAIPSFALPCSGNHTCGKCRVRAEGCLSPFSPAELRLLNEADRKNGIRLACASGIEGDVTVTLPKRGGEKIIAWYHLPEFDRTEDGFGFAADIGTTTVALQLIDRKSGRILAGRVAENAQRGFGADVISRIEASKKEGVAVLSGRITDQLEEMAASCMQETGIRTIDESVVTGNSTMLHLYEGLDPSSLAVVPFRTVSDFGRVSTRTLAGAPVYLPRCVSAYVGADITCAALASDLLNCKTGLLADIGTNGEMMLIHDGKLYCCATAAGPAFEGAGLSCGMPAAPGAIRSVRLQDSEIRYDAISGAAISGICGSGILDTLAVMLERGDMDDSGYLEDENGWEIGNSGIVITQKDVRQIQLAKAAVCGGILTLLDEVNLSAGSIERFFIAGGFGNSMNTSSASAIGLFPNDLESRSEFIGNAALGGAAMLLMNPSLRTETEQRAEEALELSLSGSAAFTENYVDCMAFDRF